MDEKTEKLLHRTITEHADEYVRRLLDLVAIDTQDIGHGIDGGREEEGQIYLEKFLGSLGADTSREPLSEDIVSKGLSAYGEGNPGHNYKSPDRWNLIASFGGEKKGRSLIFDGHIDTMPPGDLSLWSSNPWNAEVRDGKAYGLGACDMKGGLMASVLAVKCIIDAGLNLPGPVTILSVADEEGGGNGSLAAMLAGHRADAAVVCEPSDGTLTVAHMGFIFFSVEVSGIALHSGSKWNGVNAIEKAAVLMDALGELEHRWLMTRKHPLLPPPTLNIGVISGGTAGSTVPDKCVFKLCLHYHPAMGHDLTVREVTDAIMTRAAGDEWLRVHPPKIEIYHAGGAFEMETGHEFVKTASLCVESVKGAAPALYGSPAGNDARLLRNIGGMPTVVMGPGQMAQCHSIDEYVEVKDFLAFIEIYAQLILEWCREP
ncbi:MAG: ArgE/DapE family deacylase [Synergistaceae bacterium]|jgi:acetylornithine deacetylase|nr:ArgE/DapE family deacylase [Synergistaceae bacterium]